MLARDAITDTVKAGMPSGVDVLPYARNIAPPSRSTVMVRIDKVRRLSVGQWAVEGALVLIAAKTKPGDADDELDGLLEDVLVALDSPVIADGLNWTEATRATYAPDDQGPTNPAYEVAVNTNARKEH